MENTLRVGDMVSWRGAWGSERSLPVVVTAIIQTRGPREKDGEAVPSLPWSQVHTGCVVDLANGHWAYGHQIAPVSPEPR